MIHKEHLLIYRDDEGFLKIISNDFNYKGFMSKVDISVLNNKLLLYGKIDNISDLVTFEGERYDSAVKEFKDSVDDYIEFCEEVNKDLYEES